GEIARHPPLLQRRLAATIDDLQRRDRIGCRNQEPARARYYGCGSGGGWTRKHFLPGRQHAWSEGGAACKRSGGMERRRVIRAAERTRIKQQDAPVFRRG